MEQYINKSDLVAEIEKLLFSFIEKSQKSQKPQFTLMGKIDVLEDLLRIINNLEVKEVDEQKERMSECPYRQVGCTKGRFWNAGVLVRGLLII